MLGISKTTLNHMEQVFFAEYISDFDPERAARRAGYMPERARKIGESILKKPEAQAVIDELVKKRQLENTPRIERVLEMLTSGVVRDPMWYINPDGTAKAPWELSIEARFAVESVQTKLHGKDPKNQTIEFVYKFVDKLKCVELAGRYLGVWKDNVKHSFDLTTLTDEQINEQLRLLGSAAGFGPVIEGETTPYQGAEDYLDVPGDGPPSEGAVYEAHDVLQSWEPVPGKAGDSWESNWEDGDGAV